MKLKLILPGLILVFGASLACAQQTAPPKSANKLVTGKLIYVAPMPGGLDQWLIQDLRAWGKYQVSGNSEGVDLVVRARTPPKEVHYTRSEHIPVRHHARKATPVLSITIVNWVSGEKLWDARILNRARKKGSHPSPGPDTEIYARNMKPDQVAERCVRRLRGYVAKLEAQR